MATTTSTTPIRRSAVHTVVAIPLGLVTFVVVGGLVTFLFYLFYNLMTVIRPGIIQFIGSVVGGVVGVGAAKALCEKWLPRYDGKPFFVVFVTLAALSVVLEWTVVPDPAHPVSNTAQMLAAVYAAFQLFWKNIDL